MGHCLTLPLGSLADRGHAVLELLHLWHYPLPSDQGRERERADTCATVDQNLFRSAMNQFIFHGMEPTTLAAIVKAFTCDALRRVGAKEVLARTIAQATE